MEKKIADFGLRIWKLWSRLLCRPREDISMKRYKAVMSVVRGKLSVAENVLATDCRLELSIYILVDGAHPTLPFIEGLCYRK